MELLSHYSLFPSFRKAPALVSMCSNACIFSALLLVTTPPPLPLRNACTYPLNAGWQDVVCACACMLSSNVCVCVCE